MSSCAETSFYGGEVAGEAFYSVLMGAARNDVERLKWATLLQLETETKAWLRAPLLAHGVSIEEQASDRDNVVKAAEQFKRLAWSAQMRGLGDAIGNDFVPRYAGYANEAAARDNAAEEVACRFMVEHEKAQLEFARRELADVAAGDSLELVEKLLKYPVDSHGRGTR